MILIIRAAIHKLNRMDNSGMINSAQKDVRNMNSGNIDVSCINPLSIPYFKLRIIGEITIENSPDNTIQIVNEKIKFLKTSSSIVRNNIKRNIAAATRVKSIVQTVMIFITGDTFSEISRDGINSSIENRHIS
jgi:hypothetical protein